MGRTITFAHADFSGGQVNNTARRRTDIESVASGAKVQKNWRTLSTGAPVPRSGRNALQAMTGKRFKIVRMAFGRKFRIEFPDGQINVYDENGAVVAQNISVQYRWNAGNYRDMSVVQAKNDIVIFLDGNRPQVVRYDDVADSWSFFPFAFATQGAQSKQPFYRLSLPGQWIKYDDVSGTINLEVESAYFTAEMVGARLSILGQQVMITSITDPTHAVAEVAYRLPDAVVITVADTEAFQVGQIATAQKQNIKIEIGKVDAGAKTVTGVLMSAIKVAPTWTSSDTLVSPIGSSAFTAAPTAATLPVPTVQWLEEFMSDLRGWPRAGSYDRGRLIMCDFPQMREAVLESAIDATDIFWVDAGAAGSQPEAGASADAAILEFIPGRPRVRHVVGWGDQFVFTDRGIFQIPISASNPLKPGSVEFRKFSDDGCSAIPPVTMQDSIVFINAGLNRCSAVRATGSYSRPYVSEDISYEHTDLFSSPFALEIAVGDGDHPERYCYVVNADGALVVGKLMNTQQRVFIGWAPWTSQGTVDWIETDGSDVLYCSTYGTHQILEIERDAAWLDASVPVASPPAALVTGGRGPFWFLPAGAQVTLMDGARDLGLRSIDALGNVIGIDGEDMTRASLTAGLYWGSSVVEIWAPVAPQGPTMKQRTNRRNVAKAMAVAHNGTGFWIGSRFFPADEWGDDVSGQPVIKEKSYWTRPIGLSWDPTVEITVDRPGPFTLIEITGEVTP